MLFGKAKSHVDPQQVTEIAIESIAANPRQPRQAFGEERLGELAASIKKHGVIQPIVVRPVGNAFEVVVGERRLRAARLAGLRKVPAIVREMNSQEMAVMALIENLQREDLNVMEEARGYKRLLEEFKFTQSEVGRLVGKGQSTIANKLRLLRLPEGVQARILAEGVSERHARALLELPDETRQSQVLDEILERGLSVRETEERVRVLVHGPLPGAETFPGASRGAGGGSGQAGLFDQAERRLAGGRRGAAAGQLGQVSDRRAIRAFRDIRLFLNTFRRAVEMLKEAGVRAEMIESDGPEFLEVKVLIPKGGPARNPAPRLPGAVGSPEGSKAAGGDAGRKKRTPKTPPGGRW